jgi:hypothetical protein
MITKNASKMMMYARSQRHAVKRIAKETKDHSHKIAIRRENVPLLSHTKESAKAIKNQSKVVLIRHGNSMFNKLFHELEGPGYVVTPKYFDAYSNVSILDSPLSPLGVKQ